MDGRKRTVQIKFRVTEAERDLILEKMKLVPTRNMAAYLRKIAIDGYIIQIDHADIKAMTAEIQKIGVNVNQIARRVNATGNAYQEDIRAAVAGEKWAVEKVVDCYKDEIDRLSTVAVRQPDGSTKQEINEDMRQSITKKLIEALPQFPLEEMEKGNVR